MIDKAKMLEDLRKRAIFRKHTAGTVRFSQRLLICLSAIKISPAKSKRYACIAGLWPTLKTCHTGRKHEPTDIPEPARVAVAQPRYR